MATAGSAAQAGARADGAGGEAAVVPHNAIADLYLTFPPNAPKFADDLRLMRSIEARLKAEGYRTTLFFNTAEGTGNDGSATPANFVSMARASVIVFSTHGYVVRAPHGCEASSKGLFREFKVDQAFGPEPPATGDVVNPVSCTGNDPRRDRGLLVGWYRTDAQMRAALAPFANDASFEQDFQLVNGVRDDYDRPGATAVILTEEGIKHFFGDAHVTLVDAIACHSIFFATDFQATSYYGYFPTTCSTRDEPDTNLLWERLTGEEGVERRTTLEAWKAGGFNEFIQLLEPHQSVVLSPAVTSVSPAQGASVSPGKTTQASVRFDAHMSPLHPDQVVTASGCGAHVENAHWSDQQTELDFDLVVPAHPPGGELKLDVRNDRAVAPGGGRNGLLDGNAPPPAHQSGELPNGRDYLWTLSCQAQPFTVTVSESGTYELNDALSGSTTHATVSWHAKDVLTFPGGTGAQPIRWRYSFSASGKSAATSPSANESYTCTLAGDAAAYARSPRPLVIPAATGGTSGVNGYPLDDPLDIVPFVPLDVSLQPGHLLRASGGSCSFDNNDFFTPALQPTTVDNKPDWTTLGTGFQTTGRTLLAKSAGRHYTVDDNLSSGSETTTVKASVTVTATASGSP